MKYTLNIYQTESDDYCNRVFAAYTADTTIELLDKLEQVKKDFDIFSWEIYQGTTT